MGNEELLKKVNAVKKKLHAMYDDECEGARGMFQRYLDDSAIKDRDCFNIISGKDSLEKWEESLRRFRKFRRACYRSPDNEWRPEFTDLL